MTDVAIDPSAAAAAAAVARRRVRVAEVMLLLATAVWGSSFALAKEAGTAINRAAGDARALGPIVTLAIRFTIASGIVFIVARVSNPWGGHRPQTESRVENPCHAWRHGATIGTLLGIGSILQHLALDRTSEAAAAFLTSLAVVFVPLILWIVLRERPAAAAWLGVAIAVPGVWLMSGGGAFRIGAGESLGVACAFVFAVHLLAIDRWAASLGALRACLAQFATVAIICWPISLALLARGDAFDPHVLLARLFVTNVALLVAGPTLVSFGLMAAFQPRVPPVRAVLIYLLEPLFAASFAWLWNGRTILRGEVAGGALILVANLVVELRARRMH